MTNFKKSQGFTLIELLMATSIAITCSTIVVAIITSSFRSSTRANSQEYIRQAGTGALSQVGTIIQYADDFKGAYVLSSGVYKKITCPTTLSSSSSKIDQIQVFKDQQYKKITCDYGRLILDDRDLIDNDSVDEVSCTLRCSRSGASETPIISITIVLSSYSNATESKIQNLTLSKTIKMANL